MDPRDVPILILGFNRPDFLRELLEELRELRPRRIYLAVDGPRSGTPTDQERVALSREQVNLIDWPCDVSTRFNDSNLGCGLGVSSAISWFFENEEFGIILEDDIRPDPSLFPFMAEMLTRFRDDERVFAVTGTNFVPSDYVSTEGAYRFSRIPVVWGWGTWRRAWQKYAFDITGWHKNWSVMDAKRALGGTWPSYAYWSAHFALVSRGRIDTWDYQVVCAAMKSRALTVTPNVNLVTNVGFGSEATHTRKAPSYLQERHVIDLEGLEHLDMQVDEMADGFQMADVYGASFRGMASKARRGLADMRRD